MVPNVGVGTFLVGYCGSDVTYAMIVKAFGKPNGVTDGYKIDARWCGFINGEVFTIYNYKSGKNYLGARGPATKFLKGDDWHIGGHDDAVVALVNEYIH